MKAFLTVLFLHGVIYLLCYCYSNKVTNLSQVMAMTQQIRSFVCRHFSCFRSYFGDFIFIKPNSLSCAQLQTYKHYIDWFCPNLPSSSKFGSINGCSRRALKISGISDVMFVSRKAQLGQRQLTTSGPENLGKKSTGPYSTNPPHEVT